MHLSLSQTSLHRTQLLDPESRRLYKISTTDDGGFTSIYRTSTGSSASSQSSVTSDAASEFTLVDSPWYELARICWSNSSLTQVSLDMDVSCFNGKFVKKQALHSSETRYITNLFEREFVFADAKSSIYRWSFSNGATVSSLIGPVSFSMLTINPQLSFNETFVARFHRPKGLLKPTKPSLEVNDEYLYMMDAIVVTLVYVERKRKLVQEDDSSTSVSDYANRMYSLHSS